MSQALRRPRAYVRLALAASLALALTGLAACGADTDEKRDTPGMSSESPSDSPATTAPTDGDSGSPDTPDSGDDTMGIPEAGLDLALSTPVADSVYPDVGHPGVDALHYGLDLTWNPDSLRLDGVATVTFRATSDANKFQLDLSPQLKPSKVTVDGKKVEFRHPGKDLKILTPVAQDEQYVAAITYSGVPRPWPAPTTRSDFSTTGLTLTKTGEVWTMQEPYGAFTWYPVHDHPSDKALYDFTIHAPAPWTGIANGQLIKTRTKGRTRTTTWHLAEPAASYLVTLAIGDYAHDSGTTDGGLTVDYWYPTAKPQTLKDLKAAPAAVDWIEKRLGPYPFDTLGLVVTRSDSAMETQTMVTLGDTDYVLSPAVIQHELVHQWVGDKVSPNDWRDVWINEGLTMLLQWMYEDDTGQTQLKQSVTIARQMDKDFRTQYGPPGDYDSHQFGSSNIYWIPALMWNELRLALGEEEFFRIVQAWLDKYDNQSVTREQLYDFWEAETGRELSAFFDAWIIGRTTPSKGVPG